MKINTFALTLPTVLLSLMLIAVAWLTLDNKISLFMVKELGATSTNDPLLDNVLTLLPREDEVMPRSPACPFSTSDVTTADLIIQNPLPQRAHQPLTLDI